MAFTFLPPDSGQEPCGVSVGVVAGASGIEQIAASFRGLVDVCSIPEFSSAVGYDVGFWQSENPQEVEVVLPHGNDPSRVHRILVSVAGSPFPVLDSVACAVLAPAFAPGGVGIDWNDVCTILRSGKRGVLVLAESGEAVTNTLGLAESVLAKEDSTRVAGVMAAVFAPQGKPWVESVRQLGRAAVTLAPNAGRLVAAPVISGDAAICAVLAVFPE